MQPPASPRRGWKLQVAEDCLDWLSDERTPAASAEAFVATLDILKAGEWDDLPIAWSHAFLGCRTVMIPTGEHVIFDIGPMPAATTVFVIYGRYRILD